MTEAADPPKEPSEATLIRAILTGRVIPSVSTLPWTGTERQFKITERAATEARHWALEWLPTTCKARDDLAIVLTELVANLAEHGAGESATITLAHGERGLRGQIIDHAPPAPSEIDVPWTTLEEVTALHALDVPPPDEVIATLTEGGRGLLVVTTLCQAKVDIQQYPDHTVTRWHLDDCSCHPTTEI